MQLPNRESAYIPREKLTGYLLLETHPVGKAKANFFRALGYNEGNVELLEKGLLGIAHDQEVDEVEETPRGTKYALNGALPTPGGRVVRVRTVWIVAEEQASPRFVTAYPADDGEEV